MTIHFGSVPAGAVLPVHFATYNAAGASVTLSGLAVTDIEIYKGTTVTQRSSDAGYALIDTDGIDIDGITGAHGFTIDTGDNTDSGFYSVGDYFNVWVSAVTVDSQTVNFLAATFRLVAAETAAAGIPEVKVASISANAITATAINADAITAAKVASDVGTELADALLDRSAGVETGLTLRQWLRLGAAALFGKASGLDTTTAVYRDTGDSKNRITATVTADGNRTAVTLDAS